MRPLILAAALLAVATSAEADVYVRSPWGFALVAPTGPFAYGPGRVPPGFRAPPVPDPYARTRAEQFAPAPPPGPAGGLPVGHNGSLMNLEVDQATGAFAIRYVQPKPSLAAIGILPGTLLVNGQMNPPSAPAPPVQATAHVYDRYCGAMPYPVAGRHDGPVMILEGPAPVVWAGTCTVAEYIWSHNSYLRFELLRQ